MSQPTEPVTQCCPNCQHEVTMVPYNIGSGPELACPKCEWCWGAQGQVLLALEPPRERPAFGADRGAAEAGP